MARRCETDPVIPEAAKSQQATPKPVDPLVALLHRKLRAAYADALARGVDPKLLAADLEQRLSRTRSQLDAVTDGVPGDMPEASRGPSE